MPEPNTPWYAWSGEVSKQGAGRYIRAWRHVRHVVRQASQGRIRLMWTPYARSVPDEPGNRIRDYFPGRDQVDAVGAVAYNFGTTDVLDWTAPQALFARAYATIDRLARKPFWLAETGSTGLGGSKAGWIGQLGAIRSAMPRLRGVLWYDVREPNGDFRITQTPATTAAFSGYLGRRLQAVAGRPFVRARSRRRASCFFSPRGALVRVGASVPSLEAGSGTCSSDAEATHRKRRNASSSTPPRAVDPIRKRDPADRRRAVASPESGGWLQRVVRTTATSASAMRRASAGAPEAEPGVDPTRRGPCRHRHRPVTNRAKTSFCLPHNENDIPGLS